MKIGTFLNLETDKVGSQKAKKYRCKIIEFNENQIIIDYPVHIKTRKTTYFQKDTHFIVSFVDDDQSVYRFQTKIEAKLKKPFPCLALQYPDEEKIQRIQRREYVRIETAVDVAIHSTEANFPSFTTVTTDLSGGGLSIIIPKSINMRETDILNICLVFQMQSGEYHYIYTTAEVTRVNLNKNNTITASIKFLSLAINNQQLIVRYCFEKQREARKKELI